MKKLLTISCWVLLAPVLACGQNSAYSDIVLSGQGRPIAGAQVSVCNTPGLATTAASVTSNIAVLTFGSSPITAGFVAGMTLQVSGFTGADTYFNGGTLSGGVITGGFTVLSVTSTTLTYALTHANASATSNGSAFQQGNSINSCAPLASITSDQAGLVPITQPGLATDGIGNYSFFAAAANYFVQFSGAGITLKLKPVNLPISPANANNFTVLQTFSAGFTSAGPNTLNGNNIAATLGPTAGQQHTIPAVASDTYALLAAAQTLVAKTLASPIINGTPTGTGIATLTLKSGSTVGPNYSGTNTGYANVDTTNLCQVVTVPTGWKLQITATGVGGVSTGAVGVQFSVADIGTTCGGGGTTPLKAVAFTPPATGLFDVPFAITTVLNGDGAAHAISLQALTANAADAWQLESQTNGLTPSLALLLMPSN